MSLTDPNIIDMWGIPKSDSGAIILGIADHLEWGNKTLQAEHLLALQRKINGYIAFIESGEIYNKIPAALGKSLVIRVYGKYEVSEQGELFFERVAELLRKMGIGFEFVFKAD
ncbi:hypothetical protein GRW89_17525 [Pseudomonas moraviensis]|uniref:DUF6572 domain-containing protein n=1 Tax=Pseudomonas iranensis TaxID=2745503 RepID=A0AAU7F3P9_9PSED|nr:MULTISPECIES: DUF6572 domain-containing protein [Pseudomonas]OFJ45414.1 hypothetical protein BJN42_13150 [Pseudomonas koreensis]RRW68463.1 hypothetical protein EGJ53_01545 [Pseudomonas fluorescens]MBJ7369966.1 hypothetical protein [Pseudomonas sp.]MDT6921490.1 hypothetical protein [Pseudomonas atacamensis]MXI48304.1 hypothetical protein [Pseudomonas moraviensis]